MKKASLFFFLLVVGVAFNGFSQTQTPASGAPAAAQTPTAATTSASAANPDFFAGKWAITVFGTPNGDAKLNANLVRKDGKLTGEMKDATGQSNEPIPLTKVEEDGNKITLYFEAQGMDINIFLEKAADDDHLKGSLMGMFDSTAVRIKE